MKIQKLIFINLILFLTFQLCVAQQKTIIVSTASAENIEKAKELWEKVIAAKGGRENLHAVKTLVVSLKSDNPYDSKEFRKLHIEDFCVLPNKRWKWIDQRPGFLLVIEQYDFEKGIGYHLNDTGKLLISKPLSSPNTVIGRTPEVLQDEHFRYMKEDFLEFQLFYLMETKWFQPEILGTHREQVHGKKEDVIEVGFGRVKLEYFIDPKTYLPNKIGRSTWFEDIKKFDADDEQYVEDYVEVEGIKLPQAIKRGKKTDSKTTYEINGKYNENLFNTPPRIDLGPDIWKTR